MSELLDLVWKHQPQPKVVAVDSRHLTLHHRPQTLSISDFSPNVVDLVIVDTVLCVNKVCDA